MRFNLVLALILLAAANLAAWGWAVAVFGGSGPLLGLALLAYTFGLRHGVDADHIAAIDNVTRRLTAMGRRSWDAGLYFSLGHSTVVVALSVAAALAAGVLARMGELKSVGSVVGTSVSALFLIGIGWANLGLLRDSWTHYGRLRAGRDADTAPRTAAGPGARLFGRLFARIGHGWQMYPLGLLFGLGFDTATEVGLLGLSAAQAGKVGLWGMLVFPALFAAAMSLVDMIDSMAMSGAYGWAADNPLRKAYYNLTITGLSVVMAFGIGALEVLGLAAERWGLTSGAWPLLARLNDHFDLIGLGLAGLFALCWGASMLVYRWGGQGTGTGIPAE